MFRIMKYETMVKELLNHEQTKHYSDNDISYFATSATTPDNYDTIISYIEQDKEHSVLYTKKMFVCLAQMDGVVFEDVTIYSNMTSAIIDIFNNHIMDASTFVNITSDVDDVIETLLHMKEKIIIVEESLDSDINQVSSNENDDCINEACNSESEDSSKNIDSDNTEQRELIITQLKRNHVKNSSGKRYSSYIERTIIIYEAIETAILKGESKKQLYSLFGREFRNKKCMDAIILSIKQIITQCDDISETETDDPVPIGEQVSNHINGFSLERNIVAPMSDISHAVKQHFVTTSINNINRIESFASTIDNPFIQLYVNKALGNIREKCIQQIR